MSIGEKEGEKSLNHDGELAKREFEKRACCVANFGSEEECALQQGKLVKQRKRSAEANPLFKRDGSLMPTLHNVCRANRNFRRNALGFAYTIMALVLSTVTAVAVLLVRLHAQASRREQECSRKQGHLRSQAQTREPKLHLLSQKKTECDNTIFTRWDPGSWTPVEKPGLPGSRRTSQQQIFCTNHSRFLGG
ncbi:uncharacterized protein EAE98_011383 [Botrytis deweyae]|uniref:Brl1/Brr6 domain-containing protein n=1 Tax=Botrytis deweyae TaxID=2478750 RepID=A0ABQ7I6C0_9HELO|nr:uncharacterized protein EAE98_011383 [Botrytis deweyae]KAF7915060.1 hypothetical protein EAE98_011383 [Botrytis deweyae]